MKELIGHLIYKIMSTPNFIRQIEWQKMLKYLDAKEDERILEIRWSGKLWMGVYFIAYPLCLVSDRLFWESDKGYMLIADGEKAGNGKYD